MPYAEPALAGTAGSLFAFPTRLLPAECKGWVVRNRMVERIVRHLTDFRPLPNARTTDVSTIEARTQRELSHRPNRRSENQRPAPRVCALSVAPTAARHRFTPEARARGKKAATAKIRRSRRPIKTKRE
jgi:hypothetical protein